MRGQPLYNAQPHTRLPPRFLYSDVWIRIISQLNVALIHKLCGSFVCLAYFRQVMTYFDSVFNNQALVDARSIGVGIKCLYCTFIHLYIFTYIHTHIYTYIHAYVHTYIHIIIIIIIVIIIIIIIIIIVIIIIIIIIVIIINIIIFIRILIRFHVK